MCFVYSHVNIPYDIRSYLCTKQAMFRDELVIILIVLYIRLVCTQVVCKETIYFGWDPRNQRLD